MEKNPTRVVLSDEEYEALLKVSGWVGWRFRAALVLAHETGHRIGAIRKLRWCDIDFEERTILWRAEHEKTGYEHRTPVIAEAIRALEEARRMSAGTGDAPVLPAPRDPSACVNGPRMAAWWKSAERRAGLEPKRGRGLCQLSMTSGQPLQGHLFDEPRPIVRLDQDERDGYVRRRHGVQLDLDACGRAAPPRHGGLAAYPVRPVGQDGGHEVHAQFDFARGEARVAETDPGGGPAKGAADSAAAVADRAGGGAEA